MSENLTKINRHDLTAARFKAVRKQLKLTQAQMAQELGVTRATIADWESKSDREYLSRMTYLSIQALLNLEDVRLLTCYPSKGHPRGPS